MALYTTQGTVYEVGSLKEGETNGKEWKIRNFVLEEQREYNGKMYSDFLSLTLFNKAVDSLADVAVGDKVDASFSIRSTERTSQTGKKYWSTDARCISLKVLEGVAVSTTYGTTAPPPPDNTNDDDLPF